MSRARTIGQVQKVTRAESNGQNLENKDLIPRVAFLPLAYHWSFSFDPLTFHITGYAVQPLHWHVDSHAG